jgi:hypothetical protein
MAIQSYSTFIRRNLSTYHFFEAAIREDAFIEGQQGKISFEEEDPVLFRRVVEFLYEGDCFPRQKLLPASFGFEVPLKVKSTALDSKEEDYVPSLAVEMASGTYLATAETHQLFTVVAKLLCVADRYIIEDLVEMGLSKVEAVPYRDERACRPCPTCY